VRFVERALGVRLDYTPETLPILDHYLEQARTAQQERPETLAVVAHTCGAYFGEVVRRRYASWWRMDGSDPSGWQIELEAVFLSFSPVDLISSALLRGEPSGGAPSDADDTSSVGLTLDEEDRRAVSARLAELPPVSDEEFYAPSTRLEVIDIAVEAIRARRMAQGEEVDDKLTPEDYEAAD
jgi:hypothetical protein